MNSLGLFWKNLCLYLKGFLDRYVYFIPIIAIFITLITNFIEYKGNAYNYIVLGNSIGYSLMFNVGLWYLFNFKGNYCWFTRNAPIGLFMVNIVDILGSYVNYVTYSKIFNIAICSVIITLALVFYIIKKIKA